MSITRSSTSIMDQRHLFTRQPALNHPLDPPIPPPPYSSRPDFAPHNDIFFPRRQQYENPAASPTKNESPVSYGVPPPPYPPNPFAQPAAHSQSVNDGRGRRSSYESTTLYEHLQREEHERRSVEVSQQGQAVPPPPPPPPSSFHPSYPQSNYAQDLTRRPTSNGTSSQAMYGRPEHSPPPHGQYGPRQMLPPTSPQYAQTQFSSLSQANRATAPNIPFARDLPALSAAHRPGSSMSISSMLGQALDMPPRDSVPQHRDSVYSAQSTTPTQSSSTRNPRNSPPLSAFAGNQQAKRSHTPDYAWRADPLRSRAYSGGHPPRSFASFPDNQQDAPQSGQRAIPYQIPQKPYEPRYTGSQVDMQAEPRRSSNASAPPNGGYQRPGLQTPPGDLVHDRERPPHSPESTRSNRAAPNFQSPAGNLARPGDASYHHEETHGQLYGPALNPPTQASTRPGYASKSEQHTTPGLSPYPFLNRSIQHSQAQEYRSDGSHGGTQGQAPEAIHKTPESGRAYDKHRSARDPGNSSSGSMQQTTRNASHLYDQAEEQHMRESNYPLTQIRKHNITSTPDRAETESGYSDEQPQQPRNLLSLILDHSKRGGRVSPLPQAVQGAQGRMKGPAGEPGIKNEFGRMFSGIGTGVGSNVSTPVPLDNATPSFPSSPTRFDESRGGTPLSHVKQRISSKPGRRSRKIKNEDAKMNVDTEDGATLARSSSTRGPKRVRQSYNLPNVHNHHHHHHVDGSATSTPFAALKNPKRSFTPNQALATTPTATPHHHHHHHHHNPHHPSHHPPHHHHHHYPAAQSTPVPAPPPRKPTVTVDNKAVFASIANLPRNHLGSQLYSPIISVPSWKLPSEELRFGYISTPKPLPRFDGKANSTFTIRVPRLYLGKSEREEICSRRALWGTEIYTDDSDPIVAAIHGGWILGEWGDDVDESTIEPSIRTESPEVLKDWKENKDAQMTLTKPPPIPMIPVKDKDLHITVLILPTLESYTGTVAHGIKSRSFPGKHDGMSFKVESITWVDEKSARGEERSGAARRKRLEALMELAAVDVKETVGVNFLTRDLGKMKTVEVGG